MFARVHFAIPQILSVEFWDTLYTSIQVNYDRYRIFHLST